MTVWSTANHSCSWTFPEHPFTLLPPNPAPLIHPYTPAAILPACRQCASGLQAIADIAGEIKLGTCKIGIAAGMEHMTSGGLDSWAGSTNPKVEENQWAKDCELPMGEPLLGLFLWGGRAGSAGSEPDGLPEYDSTGACPSKLGVNHRAKDCTGESGPRPDVPALCM